MKRYKSTKKMKRKLLLLAVAFLFLIMAIVFSQCSKDKTKRQYKEYQEKQTEKEVTEEPTEKQVEAKTTNSNDKKMDTTLGIPASALKKNVTAKIKNLDTYSKQISNQTDLLNQEFSLWLKEKSITATSGSIFYVLVPDNDPGSVEFFIHIDDSQGSLVMLAYHKRENLVTASSCNQTEIEIKAGVFEKNGPSQCDISETEDAKIRNNQEGINATTGKN